MPNTDRLATALKDRYRIERELGQGGMATVYLAEDLRHGRKVAIKVLREDLAASLGAGRFLREIQIAAQLQHPNILPLLDSGEADGFLYYVMPYVPGQSLRERLAREGELPVHEAVRLLVEVTDALAHSHQMGVVHRDIKPDNVMLSGRHALVTDFGVAKAVSEATGRNTVTTLGVALGTPTYMSPEQAAADPMVDHRSDIYAVGVMAYEMLTGRPPFTGATPQQVLAAHVTEAPDPVSKRRSAIPAPLEQLVMRCLAKRPADRFQSAEELLHLLEAQATPSTGITPTQTRPTSAWQPVNSRGRWLVPAIAAIAIVAAGLLWWGRRGADDTTLAELKRTQVTYSGTAEFTAALSPDGQRVAYADRRCREDYSCTYDLVVQEVGGAGSLRAVEGMQAIYDVHFSGNGRTLLVGGLLGGDKVAYYTVPALGGEPPRLVSANGVTMFGDADSVVIGSATLDGRLVIRATTLGNPTRGDSLAVDRNGLRVFDWGVSPDGRWIVIGIATSSINRLLVMDRRGVVRDSVDGALPRGSGFIADDRIILSFAEPASPDTRILEEHRIDANGRLGPGRRLASQIPANGVSMSVSTSGVAYLAGTTQSNVIAISRDADARRLLSTRLVTTTTGRIGALMGSNGNFVILERPDPADPQASRLFVQPFEGGEERLVGGTQLSAGSVYSRTVDSRGLIVLTRDGDQTIISEIDLATGQSTPRGSMPFQGGMQGLEALADGSIAWQPESELSTIRIRQPSGKIRTARTPQVATLTMEDSPEGHGLIGWGYSLPTFDSLVVWHLPPDADEARSLVRGVFDYIPGHHWLADGNAELVINETLATAAFYHLDVASGRLVRQGTIPLNFIASASFSNDGRMLVARTTVPTLDVWVLR